jgi:hypothetical protein
VIALTSTFSPVIGGPDSPAVAVMSVLAASIATALAAKGAPTAQIVINVLVALSVSTLLTGVLLYGVGALKMGQWLRFIPYPVIGGFLAASGILLITGGMEVVTQTNLTLSPLSWQLLFSPLYAPQILIGALFAISIPLLGRFVPNYLALPIAFFGFLIILDVALFGFFNDEEIHNAWFLPSLGELSLWWPLTAMIRQQVDWGVIARSARSDSFAACAMRCWACRPRVAPGKRSRPGFRSSGLAVCWRRCSAALGSLSMNACCSGRIQRHYAGRRHYRHRLRHLLNLSEHRCWRHGAQSHPRRDARLSRRRDPHRTMGRAGAKLLDGMGAHRRDDPGHHQFRIFHGRRDWRDRRLPDVRAEL